MAGMPRTGRQSWFRGGVAETGGMRGRSLGSSRRGATTRAVRGDGAGGGASGTLGALGGVATGLRRRGLEPFGGARGGAGAGAAAAPRNEGSRLAARDVTVASPWTAWKGSDGQVAGYFETYAASGSFTFLTVKGAGHMVPKDRPRHALDMFTRFLANDGYDKVPANDAVAPLCPSA